MLLILRKLLLPCLLLVIIVQLQAQAPQQMNYQAVVRDGSGQPLPAGTSVTMRFQIHDISPSGATVYTETATLVTNQFGLVNYAIGYNGSLATVNWGNGAKYLQVLVDENGGNNFTDMGASQLLSVPYALYAGNSGGGTGGVTGPTGTDGLPGADGETGPTGAQGLRGATGVAGINGNNGATGAQGIQGVTGAAGTNGAQGLQGVTGAVGSNGTPGLQGITGATGINGTQGIQGVTGNDGAVGATGATGIDGAQGMQGVTGIDGAQGIQGVTGNDGAVGATGATGIDGAQGIQGVTGADGVQGTTGIDGAQGIQGVTGNDGAVGAIGVTGADGAQGIEGVTGVDGAQGATGADGAQGIQGVTGNDGAVGAIGVTGADGAQGIQGVTGVDGAQGVTGIDGAQGIQGVTGNDGAVGVTGITGADGAQGIQGITGADGAQGIQGVTGNDGAIGAMGVTGADGAQGIQGITGANGAQGIQGVTGNDGAVGAMGTTGADGAQGIQGTTGADGAQGIQGVTGNDGAVGATGADGAQGLQGDTGATGDTGPTGLTGATGLLAPGTTPGNTTFWNGTQWLTNNSNIFNNGANVGINTTTPAARLEVNGGVKIDGSLGVGTNATFYQVDVVNGNGARIGGPSGRGTTQTSLSLGGNGSFSIDSPGVAGGRFLVKENGNVGVGTNNPTAKLDVVGPVRFDNLNNGLLQVDGSGNVSVNSGSGSFIVNGVSQQSGANFNVDGNGTVGGNLQVNGQANGQTPPVGDSTTKFATTAFVTKALDSAGGTFIANGSALQTGANFNIDGNGYFGGIVGIGIGNTGYLLNVGYGGGLRVSGQVAGSGAAFSMGGHGNFEIDADHYPAGRFVVQDNGNVGIGISTPSQNLEVSGNTAIDGALGVGTSNPQAQLDVAGNILFENYNSGLLAVDGSGYVYTTNGSGLFTAGNGLSWSGNTLNSNWTTSGNNVYNNNTGNVGVGTSTPSAQLHTTGTVRFQNYPSGMIGTDASGNLQARTITGTTQQIDVTNGNGVSANPAVAINPSYTESMKAAFAVSGGGTLNYDNSGNFSWDRRFIVMDNGNNSNFTTNGFFEINMPAANTTITGTGGVGDITVSNSGIAIGGWEALYYALPIGQSYATVNDSFRIVGYGGNYNVPANWLLIAMRNGDDNTLKVCNGVVLNLGNSATNSVSGSYIANTTGQQNNANFNISGNGTVGGTLQVGSNGQMQSALDNWGTVSFTGNKGGYYGAAFGATDTSANWMWDGNGNGGMFYPGSGGWEMYYNHGTHHFSVGYNGDQGHGFAANGDGYFNGGMTVAAGDLFVSGNGNIQGGTLSLGSFGQIESSVGNWGSISLMQAKGGWYGVSFGNTNAAPLIMYDGNSNGGLIDPNWGWANYYNASNHHFSMVGTADLGSMVNVNGTMAVSGALTLTNYANGLLAVDGSGNVSVNNTSLGLNIGGATPAQTLDVNGTGLFRNGSTGNNQLSFAYNHTPDYQQGIKTRHNGGSGAGNDIDFYLWTPSDAIADPGSKLVMSIDGAGDVGIGTANPAHNLDVVGDANISTALAVGTNLNVTGKGNIGTTLGVGVSTPTQALDVVGGAVFRTGNTANPQITFGFNGQAAYQHAIRTRHNGSGLAGNAIDFYVWNEASDAIAAVGTKQVMTLDGNGFVGIGTNAPAVKLDVEAGTTSPAFKLVDGTQGSNKILTSDASGNATWQSSSVISTNIYNSDGTLTGTRTVTMSGNALNLNGGTVNTDQDMLVNGLSVGTGNGPGTSSTTQSTIFGAGAVATGNNNTAIGFFANNGASGSSNTGIGTNALRNSGTGSGNTAVGSGAGGNHGGSNNTFLGSSAIVSGNFSNATGIGSNAYVGASNSMVLGSINGVNGATSSVNVGIGTTTPATALDVESTTSPAFKLVDGTQGANKVLTSDASGNATWQTASGGGSTHAVGDYYGGGVVFWVDPTGTHGLICAVSDQSTGAPWHAGAPSGSNTNTFAYGSGTFTGAINTSIIISTQAVMFPNVATTYAARICNEYSVTVSSVNYGGWYLPSQAELQLMYNNMSTINTTAGAHGGSSFATTNYWCSTEASSYNGQQINFSSGGVSGNAKDSNYHVRAVRAF